MQAAAVALAGLGLASAALAGPLAVRGPDGTRWRVDDDADPVRLERRAADGQLDPAFGRQGRVDLDFGGPEVGVAALRVDVAGRIWLGATAIGSDVPGPLVQRLQPDGRVDTRWAAGGRSSATPASQRLSLVDLLPQADGSLWLAGNLYGPRGDSSAALWRLRPDGALDYGFGTAGLWRRPGNGYSRVLSLAPGPDGSVALGLASSDGREIHTVHPGERQPRLPPGTTPAEADTDDDEAYLLFDGRAWSWRPGPQSAGLSGLPLTATAAIAPPAAPSAAGDAGHIALNPFAGQDSAASAATPLPVADELPWPWLGLGAMALAGLGALWRRRARNG